MEPGSHLKSLLQFQLASDASSVINLPYCLATLTTECLLPSTHIAKWASRINSLICSKESGARWAGLCLAHKTSLLSRSIMIDRAQSWLVVVLPALSRRSEAKPILKAALRLMRVIFTAAIDISEFHRQVCIPNVVKCSTAVLTIANSNCDPDLKVLCIETLTHLVALYPVTHRATSSNLSAFSIRFFRGTADSRVSLDIIKATSELYSILPTTGGKVGSVNLWRKSVDETLAFGWDAALTLRTTFAIQMPGKRVQQSLSGADPVVAIPLNLDRLQCSVLCLCDLLRTAVHRPVKIPFGSLVTFGFTLVSCSSEEKLDGFIDPLIHSMEVAVVPILHCLGCELLRCLAEGIGPHLTRLLKALAFRLEQKPDSVRRLKFLDALESLLKTCYVVDSSSLMGRIAMTVLPSAVKIVTSAPSRNTNANEALPSNKKSVKKRARNFEGDEILRGFREVICPTSDDQDVLIKSISVLGWLLKKPSLSSAIRSVIGRVMIAISVTLPRMPASALSSDPRFIRVLAQKVKGTSLLIGFGTTNALSKALPFIIEATRTSHEYDTQKYVELLLHPRLPPTIRSMPYLESLSLFKVDESHEEASILSSLKTQTQDVNDFHNINNAVPDPMARGENILQKESSLGPQRSLSKVFTHKNKVTDTVVEPKPSMEPSSPEEPIPNSTILFPVSSSSQLPLITMTAQHSLVATSGDKSDDEEMPTINMSSDSEVDED